MKSQDAKKPEVQSILNTPMGQIPCIAGFPDTNNKRVDRSIVSMLRSMFDELGLNHRHNLFFLHRAIQGYSNSRKHSIHRNFCCLHFSYIIFRMFDVIMVQRQLIGLFSVSLCHPVQKPLSVGSVAPQVEYAGDGSRPIFIRRQDRRSHDKNQYCS